MTDRLSTPHLLLLAPMAPRRTSRLRQVPDSDSESEQPPIPVPSTTQPQRGRPRTATTTAGRGRGRGGRGRGQSQAHSADSLEEIDIVISDDSPTRPVSA
jgi:hypothetical protein